MQALAAAWPDRIAQSAFRDGDWMVLLGTQWFAWADGRMLPEEDRGDWEKYAPMTFYRYPLELPSLSPLSDEQAAAIRSRVKSEQLNPPRRNEQFLGALLHAGDRQSTAAHLVYMQIAGFPVTVHESIRVPLLHVASELAILRGADAEVAAFLRSLHEMDGYNYRFVEGTRTRSLHSYGLAIDMIPRSYGGKHAYWQWAMSTVSDWWAVPYAERWMPPQAFVKAFEREGFVWGGKWLFFDTMHFEYRPEIFRLAAEDGLPADAPGPQGR